MLWTILAVIGGLVAGAVALVGLWLGWNAGRGMYEWYRDRDVPPLPGQVWRQGVDLYRIEATSPHLIHLVREDQGDLDAYATQGPRRWSEPRESFRRRPGRILVRGPRVPAEFN